MRSELVFGLFLFAASGCSDSAEGDGSADRTEDAQAGAAQRVSDRDAAADAVAPGDGAASADAAAASFELSDPALQFADADPREVVQFCRFYSEQGTREYDVAGECTADASWELGPGEACEMERAKCIAEDDPTVRQRQIESCEGLVPMRWTSCTTTMGKYRTCVEELAAVNKRALKNFACNRMSSLGDWIGAPASCTGLEACPKVFPRWL